MSNSIDRTSARSTKGWMAGEHICSSNLNSFLSDAEANEYIDSKKPDSSSHSISLERP